MKSACCHKEASSPLTCWAYCSEVGPTGTTMTCRGDSQNGLASIGQTGNKGAFYISSHIITFHNKDFCMEIFTLAKDGGYCIISLFSSSHETANRLIPVKWHMGKLDLLFSSQLTSQLQTEFFSAWFSLSCVTLQWKVDSQKDDWKSELALP